MVDKPGRRKKRKTPWGKIVGGVVLALIVAGSAYLYYEDYVYKPPPIYAAIGTSFGIVEVELFPACAPQTVANFVSLARSGFYDNLVWHRIAYIANPTSDFVIQTGDPNTRNGVNSTRSTWGQGGSGQTIPLEWCGRLHNYAGYLGMARSSDPNSATSQFYINLSNGTANLSLDPNYAVFARVISGMDVVCSIAKVPVYKTVLPNQPITPVFMTNVTILSSTPVATPAPIVSC